jgi:hypothetical protein
MRPSQAIRFSISVLIIATAIALSTKTGPDSPRARAAAWLRAHDYPELGDYIDPASTVPIIETYPRQP